MSFPFIKSSELPMSFFYYIPRPSYDPASKNCIVISTDRAEFGATAGIYKYNLVSNESQIVYKYDDTFKHYYHGQFIDTSNNTLILYGKQGNTFDLNTNQMKQTNDKNIL
eukprot:488198_1